MANPSTIWARIQAGSVDFATAPPSGVSIDNITHSVRQRIVDSTGAYIVTGANQVTRQQKCYTQGVPTLEFQGTGHIATSAGVKSLAQASTIAITGASSAIDIRITTFQLRKAWALQNFSNSANAEWIYGIPVYGITCRGWATGTAGPGTTTTQAESVVLSVDNVGTLTWNTDSAPDGKIIVQNFDVHAPLEQGGGCPASFSALFMGPVQYTPNANNNLDWLFIDAADQAGEYDDPVRKSLTFDTSAESVTQPVLIYDAKFNFSPATGGKIPVELRMRADGT